MSSITSFANYQWVTNAVAGEYHHRDYPSIDTSISLYTNGYYANYVEWLGGLANSYVTSNSPLTANELANFVTQIASYDGWSLAIQHEH